MRQVPAIKKRLTHLADDGTLTCLTSAWQHAASGLPGPEAL